MQQQEQHIVISFIHIEFHSSKLPLFRHCSRPFSLSLPTLTPSLIPSNGMICSTASIARLRSHQQLLLLPSVCAPFAPCLYSCFLTAFLLLLLLLPNGWLRERKARKERAAHAFVFKNLHTTFSCADERSAG